MVLFLLHLSDKKIIDTLWYILKTNLNGATEHEEMFSINKYKKREFKINTFTTLPLPDHSNAFECDVVINLGSFGMQGIIFNMKSPHSLDIFHVRSKYLEL